jgi:lipoprotein NlpI/transglutaminase-like putative cysteine protease
MLLTPFTITRRCFVVIALFANTLLAPQSSAAPKKVDNQGFSYWVDAAPAWVSAAPTTSAAQKRFPSWHYRVSDEQTLVGSAANTSRFVRVVRHINDVSGLQDGARFEVLFDPSYQRLTFHDIDLIRNGAKIDSLKPQNLSLLRREGRLEQSQYDGKVTASAVIAGAQVGDQLSYSYTITGSNPAFGDRFVSATTTRFTSTGADYVRLRYVYPSNRTLKFLITPNANRADAAINGGLNETVITRSNIDKLDVENTSDPAVFLADSVDVSEYGNWAEVVAWGQAMFAYTPGSQANTKALGEEIRKKHPSNQAAQALAAIDFVQRDIRYFGVFLGDSSHRPNPADQVLSKRYGDCKDKTMLSIALLRELGFDATPVLVSQFYRHAIARALPSPYAFDHVIVALNFSGQRYWLDPTRLFSAGPLENRQAWMYRQGLVLQSDVTALASAPNRPAGDYDVEVVDTFDVKRLDQTVTLRSEVKYKGEIAERIQFLMNSPQRQAFEGSIFEYLDRRYPEQARDRKITARLDPVSGDYTVSSDITINDMFDYPDERMLLSEHAPWSITSEFRLPPNQRTDYFLGAQRRIKHRLIFDFAQAIRRDSTKSEVSTTDPHFRFQSVIDQSPTRLQSSYTYETLLDVVPRERWTAYSEKVKDAFGKSVLSIRLGPVGLDEQARLQADLQKIVQRIERKELLTVTETQARARMEEYVQTVAIESGRLTKKNQAAALRARAIHRDHLGNGKAAMDDIKRSIELNPNNADAFGSKAEIEFGLGLFEDAAASIAKELETRGDATPGLLYQRGRVRFQQGKLNDALADFTQSAQARSGDSRSFALLWAAITYGRLGEDVAAKIKALVPEMPSGDWPAPVLSHLIGEKSEGDVLKAAREAKSDGGKRERLCEASFFLGHKQLIANDRSAAIKHFEKSIDTEVTEFIEYRASQFELKKLGVAAK